MKLKYYQEDDILVFTFSNNSVDDSFETTAGILEVDKNKEPVSLEILHASKFFAEESKILPKEIKQKFFAGA